MWAEHWHRYHFVLPLIAGKKVLDVGCNDGSLLDFFKKKGTITFGMEPTDAYKDAIANGHHITNDYFSISSANTLLTNKGKMDIITFTNVFAHIENLNEVIQSLKVLMHEETVIVVENHYLGAILEKNQFDTFYHEHPRTYSYNSFTHIAKSLHTQILKVEFPARYGGNIRVYMGKQSTYKGTRFNGDSILLRESKFFGQFDKLNSKIRSWQVVMKNKILAAVKTHGKIKAKAFPARAAILVKLLGLTEGQILCVFEKPGSMKIGHFVPGTRIPILSDDVLVADIQREKFLLNLAWHIGQEIENYLRKIGFKGEMLNILDSDEWLE